jgi:hypothetical protein
MRKRCAGWFFAIVVQVLAADPGVTAIVPGTANLYLAGMPNGTKGGFRDRAPDQSPVLVPLSLAGVTAVMFAAGGGVAHGPMWPIEPPEGSRTMGYHRGSEHGIAGIDAPFEALLGLFLGDERPDRGPAPRTLKFDAEHRAFTTLAPQLKQVFYIGSGLAKSSAPRRFLIPAGATRLFLGTMDEYGWYNNEGAFTVAVRIERPDVISNLFSVDSSVSFANWPCLPDRPRCTPDGPMVETQGPNLYHVLLPAQIEWGASVPQAVGVSPVIIAARGIACLGPAPETCSGPHGDGPPAGPGFVAPNAKAGALVARARDGRIWFSVNGRVGAFRNHEGYFEFDVVLR